MNRRTDIAPRLGLSSLATPLFSVLLSTSPSELSVPLRSACELRLTLCAADDETNQPKSRPYSIPISLLTSPIVHAAQQQCVLDRRLTQSALFLFWSGRWSRLPSALRQPDQFARVVFLGWIVRYEVAAARQRYLAFVSFPLKIDTNLL
jgi:hypothetical protein